MQKLTILHVILEPLWMLGRVIYHTNTRGYFGKWGGREFCKGGVFASGFTFRADKRKEVDDNTGGNAVCLRCGDEDVCSKMAVFGEWSEAQLCPEGSYLSGWRQNVQPAQGSSVDDTGLDNVEYRCRDAESWRQVKDMKVEAIELGTWSRWKECPRGEFICGIETSVEDPDGDDTTLNDIIHTCCIPKNKKKKKKAKAASKFVIGKVMAIREVL